MNPVGLTSFLRDHALVGGVYLFKRLDEYKNTAYVEHIGLIKDLDDNAAHFYNNPEEITHDSTGRFADEPVFELVDYIDDSLQFEHDLEKVLKL